MEKDANLPSSVELSAMGRGRSRRGTRTTAPTFNQPLVDSLNPISDTSNSGKIHSDIASFGCPSVQLRSWGGTSSRLIVAEYVS